MLRFPLSLLLALCLAGASAQAQPDPAIPPAKRKTDAERKADYRNTFFQQLNRNLKAAGLNEEEINAVSGFVALQETDRELVRKAAYQVKLAQDQNLSDQEFAVFWNDYQAVSDNYRAKRAKALEQLKEKLKWNERPKLQAALAFQGIISDDLILSQPLDELWQPIFEFGWNLDKEFKRPQRVIQDAPEAK